MQRFTSTAASAILGVVLVAAIPLREAAAESGCADGTREGLTDFQLYPNIAACAGTWTGHVSNGGHICAPGWGVCSSTNNSEELKTITFADAVAFPGCFAF